MKKKLKTILFLGTSKIQINSILSAKKFGFKIVGVDQNQFSTGKKYCDYFIKSNCNEVNFIFNKIIKYKNLKIIDIWANNDILLISRNKLLTKLKLKLENKTSTVYDLLNKKKFKYLFPENTIKNPKKKYPLLAKPILGSGSQGIIFLKNTNEYLHFRNKKKFIFEKYINNLKEYGINFFNDGNKVLILNSVYRYFDHRITYAPLGTVEVNNNKIIKILNKIKKKIFKLKILGKIKIDLGVYKKKFIIIEASPRFHGEIDTSIMFSNNSNSLADFYFSKLSGIKKIDQLNKNNFLYGYFVCYKKTSIHNLKKIFKKNRVNFVQLLKRDNYVNKKIQFKNLSTKNIYGYAFYKINKKISDKNFTNISHHINNF